MASLKQSGLMYGSLVLAATAGSIALSDDVPLPMGADSSLPTPLLSVVPPAPSSEPIPEPSPYTGLQVAPVIVQEYVAPPLTGFAAFKERCRARCWGYPEEFCAPPLGATALGHELTQIANGYAARMVLYQFDFLPGSGQLSVRGKSQLARIARWLPANGFPLYVESTPGNAELDELRRLTVWQELANGACVIEQERIVIGRPNIRPMEAGEALLLERNRLEQTGRRGISKGGGDGGTGGIELAE